jgi:hypothetical protein
MKIFIVPLFALMLSSSAYGMVYSWIDSAGVIHFTNKEHEIPPRFRTQAKALYPEQADSSSPQQSVPNTNTNSPPVQQVKPEEPQKNITLVPQKKPPEQAPKRGRRGRVTSEE